MPTAEKNFYAESGLTQWWYQLWNGPFWSWSDEVHARLNYEYWPQPDGEVVPMWKDTTRIQDSQLPGTPFPNSFAIDPKTKQEYQVPTADDVITWNVKPWLGTYGGEPVQMGKVENKRTVYRSVSYGYSWDQDLYAQVPITAVNRVEHCGGPAIASDRHVCIFDPTKNEMHELIQYDEKASDTPFTNQALGWGKWREGKLVEGWAATATGKSITATLWDRDSRLDLHRMALVLGDYLRNGAIGADGTLIRGPVAGTIFYLPTTSKSYIDMVALGGECAAIARAMNLHGIELMDRSGYTDVSGNEIPGKKPKAPAIGVQWGSWTRTTNIHLLKIRLHDLRAVA